MPASTVEADQHILVIVIYRRICVFCIENRTYHEKKSYSLLSILIVVDVVQYGCTKSATVNMDRRQYVTYAHLQKKKDNGHIVS